MIDEEGKIAATSTTDKQLMLFEVQTGKLLAKAQCGEIITGMCFTDNKRHLIVTSSQGVIYIFKLSELVIKILTAEQVQLAKAQAMKKQYTLLAQIAEDEMEDTLKRGSAHKPIVQPKLEEQVNRNSMK